jgi:hypothetical protein
MDSEIKQMRQQKNNCNAKLDRLSRDVAFSSGL